MRNFAWDVYERSTYIAEGLTKKDSDRRYGLDQEDFRAWLIDMKAKKFHFGSKNKINSI